MKRITKINENEYISKEVDHTTSLTGTIIELIIYLVLLVILTILFIQVGDKMKKELISLLIKEICNDKTCNKCKYSKIGCYLIDMIELIKKYDVKENE